MNTIKIHANETHGCVCVCVCFDNIYNLFVISSSLCTQYTVQPDILSEITNMQLIYDYNSVCVYADVLVCLPSQIFATNYYYYISHIFINGLCTKQCRIDVKTCGELKVHIFYLHTHTHTHNALMTMYTAQASPHIEIYSNTPSTLKHFRSIFGLVYF